MLINMAWESIANRSDFESRRRDVAKSRRRDFATSLWWYRHVRLGILVFFGYGGIGASFGRLLEAKIELAMVVRFGYAAMP